MEVQIKGPINIDFDRWWQTPTPLESPPVKPLLRSWIREKDTEVVRGFHFEGGDTDQYFQLFGIKNLPALATDKGAQDRYGRAYVYGSVYYWPGTNRTLPDGTSSASIKYIELKYWNIRGSEGIAEVILNDISYSTEINAGPDQPWMHTTIFRGTVFDLSNFFGPDLITSSTEGGNLKVSTGAGNDEVRLLSGSGFNNIRTQADIDTIIANGGTGSIRAGAGGDVITLNGGDYDLVYGNGGSDDFIISGGMHSISGGEGGDSFEWSGGKSIAFGGIGSDTYKPTGTGSLIVKDFDPLSDKINLSLIPNYKTSVMPGGVSLVDSFTGTEVLFLEGLTSVPLFL